MQIWTSGNCKSPAKRSQPHNPFRFMPQRWPHWQRKGTNRTNFSINWHKDLHQTELQTQDYPLRIHSTTTLIPNKNKHLRHRNPLVRVLRIRGQFEVSDSIPWSCFVRAVEARPGNSAEWMPSWWDLCGYEPEY